LRVYRYLWILSVFIPGSKPVAKTGTRTPIALWETEIAFERRYRDNDHWHNLRPDALAEFQEGDQRVRFWLEWDRATMGARDLGAKLRTYEQYVASREWFKGKRDLRFLLIVTLERDQEMRIA
jgi:hypothetical protein